MKGISIKPPWGWAIIEDHKPLENRTWSTKYRGRLVIHSSGRVDYVEYLCFKGFVEDKGLYLPIPEHRDLLHGVILGTVELYDCVSESDSPWFTGDHAFLLKDPIRLAEPIPYKGRLGLWDVPADIEEQVKKQGAM